MHLRILSLFIVLCGLFSCAEKDLLTAEEKAYLESKGTIKIAVNPYYPPYHFKNDSGELQGILIDYVSLLEEKIDFSMEIVEYENFLSNTGRCQRQKNRSNTRDSENRFP